MKDQRTEELYAPDREQLGPQDTPPLSHKEGADNWRIRGGQGSKPSDCTGLRMTQTQPVRVGEELDNLEPSFSLGKHPDQFGPTSQTGRTVGNPGPNTRDRQQEIPNYPLKPT